MLVLTYVLKCPWLFLVFVQDEPETENVAENRRFLKDFEENTTAAGAVFFFFRHKLVGIEFP